MYDYLNILDQFVADGTVMCIVIGDYTYYVIDKESNEQVGSQTLGLSGSGSPIHPSDSSQNGY